MNQPGPQLGAGENLSPKTEELITKEQETESPASPISGEQKPKEETPQEEITKPAEMPSIVETDTPPVVREEAKPKNPIHVERIVDQEPLEDVGELAKFSDEIGDLTDPKNE